MTVSIFGAWVVNCPQGEARLCFVCARKQWKQPKCAVCAMFTLSCLHIHPSLLSLLFPLGPTHPKHLLSIAASAYFPRSCCFVDIVFAQVADFSQCVACFVVLLLLLLLCLWRISPHDDRCVCVRVGVSVSVCVIATATAWSDYSYPRIDWVGSNRDDWASHCPLEMTTWRSRGVELWGTSTLSIY